MPSFATLLVRPQRRPSPPPPQADLRTVVTLGLGLWTVALVVNLVLLAVGPGDVQVVATCATGLALGALGFLWVRRLPPYDPDSEAEPTPTPRADAAEHPDATAEPKPSGRPEPPDA